MTAAKERDAAKAHTKIDGTESGINKPGHIFLLNAQNQVEKKHKGKKKRSQKGLQRIKPDASTMTAVAMAVAFR